MEQQHLLQSLYPRLHCACGVHGKHGVPEQRGTGGKSGSHGYHGVGPGGSGGSGEPVGPGECGTDGDRGVGGTEASDIILNLIHIIRECGLYVGLAHKQMNDQNPTYAF